MVDIRHHFDPNNSRFILTFRDKLYTEVPALIEVFSPTTGTFQIAHFTDGEEVSEGDTIFEIEVMKMIVTVDAPIAGHIVYHYEPGQVVSTADPVATITPLPEGF